MSRQAKRLLAPMAAVLKGLGNDVIIEGHTDNVPILRGPFKTNWELSVARSYSVIEYLSKELGVPQDIFTAAAYGEHRPVVPNDTPEGRAKNRRIEIVVMRK